MAAYEYKITFEYQPALKWVVTVWERQLQADHTRSEWRSIAHHEAPTLEGHLDSKIRLRQVLRALSGL